MAWTKRLIIQEAYGELGYSHYAFQLKPDQYAKACRSLDLLVRSYTSSKGLTLDEYPIPDSPSGFDLDEEIGVDDYAMMLVLNLAVRLAPTIGKVPSIETKQEAKRSLLDVMSAQATPRSRIHPCDMPMGSGNKWGWTGYSHYYPGTYGDDDCETVAEEETTEPETPEETSEPATEVEGMLDTSSIIVWVDRANGTPISGAMITATLSEVGETVTSFVSSEPVEFTTDSYGYTEMKLWPNIAPSTYTIRCVDPATGVVIFNETGVTVGSIDQTFNDLIAGNGNAVPDVSFTLTSTFDVVDYVLDITGTALDSDGTIAAYHWAVDGVTVSVAAALSYTITEPGVHEIRFTATDDDGAMRSSVQTLTLVEDSPALAAAIAAVETAESTTLQADVDTAQALVTALDDNPIKDSLQDRIDAIVVGLVAATSAVETAEAQQTPENQAAAQALVTALAASTAKNDLQTRLDALDAEVANVLAARALVVAAETYTWLASEQSTAQTAVDALQSSTERTALTTRLDALDDQVAAETGVQTAETERTQVAVDAAQALIDVLDAGDQVALQARLDAVYIAVTLIHQNTDPVGWANRPLNSPFLSNGFYARPPGIAANFSLSETIVAGSGWHCVHVQSDELRFNSFLAVGIQSEALAAADLGSSTDRLMIIGETVNFDGGEILGLGLGQDDLVIAINYTTSPTVYLIIGGAVVTTSSFVTTSAINLVIKSQYLAQDREVWPFQVNTGADLANRPMPAGIESALSTAGADTTGLVLGWNGSNPGTSRAAATISISGVSGTPTVGVTENLTVTCTDADLVDQSANVKWYNDGDNWNTAAPFATGATFAFTPAELGNYPIRAVYEDPEGRLVTDTAVVFVDGSISQPASTAWDAGVSHPSVADITANQARFGTATPLKLAVIGNWGMWGLFRYFEITMTTTDNSSQFGFGVSTLLNGDVMWGGRASGDDPTDGAGSFSILNQDVPGGGPTVWNNGSPFAELDGPNGWSAGATGMRFQGTHTIGFAIDALDKQDYAIVYIFALDDTLGTTVMFGSFRLRLSQLSPLYPMVYCNIASSELPGAFDVTVNGGGAAFVHDPRPIFTTEGVDQTNFEYGWLDSEVTP